MAPWLTLVIGAVYLIVAADYWHTQQPGLGLAFIGYAIGNVGLFLASK